MYSIKVEFQEVLMLGFCIKARFIRKSDSKNKIRHDSVITNNLFHWMNKKCDFL